MGFFFFLTHTAFLLDVPYAIWIVLSLNLILTFNSSHHRLSLKVVKVIYTTIIVYREVGKGNSVVCKCRRAI